MNAAEVKKKRPPKLYIVAPAITKSGLDADSWKTKVPAKYMKPPSPAKRSMKNPL
jgi:hypothetical protein